MKLLAAEQVREWIGRKSCGRVGEGREGGREEEISGGDSIGIRA